MADDYDDVSPYNYVLNNSVNYIDPDGMRVDDRPTILASIRVGSDGKIIKHKNDGDNSLYQILNGNDVKIGTEKPGVDYSKLINTQLDLTQYNPNPQLDDVNVSTVKPKEFNFWDRMARDERLLPKITYDLLDDAYFWYTNLFSIRMGPRHLDRTSANPKEVVDCGINTLISLAPIGKSTKLIPKVNIATFLKLVKGAFVARLSGKTGGLAVKALNKTILPVTSKTIVSKSVTVAKKLKEAN